MRFCSGIVSSSSHIMLALKYYAEEPGLWLGGTGKPWRVPSKKENRSGLGFRKITEAWSLRGRLGMGHE